MGRIGGVNLSKNGSFTILNDGEVEFYLEEERVTGIKRDRSAKALVLRYLDDDIDSVAICDCYTKYYPKKFLVRTREKEALCKVIRAKGIPILDYRQRHHDCHAANAFYNSGFDDCAILVMDGKGSVHDNGGYRFCETESIYNNLDPVFKHYSTFWSEDESIKLHDPYWDGNNFYSDRTSLGQAFRTISRYCGFDELDAGKTMGLSAYGHPDTPVNLWNEEYGHSICSKDIRPKKDSTEYYGTKMLEADVAYNLQKSAEKHLKFMIQKTIDLTGKKNIACSGGFFLNCVANYSILKEFDIKLYVDPIAYDGGNAVGAALLAHYEHIRN
tara:strand:+ start:153 stop:1136 length:984 start_codon:yes stop_codon:yes gene_type:complete